MNKSLAMKLALDAGPKGVVRGWGSWWYQGAARAVGLAGPAWAKLLNFSVSSLSREKKMELTFTSLTKLLQEFNVIQQSS